MVSRADENDSPFARPGTCTTGLRAGCVFAMLALTACQETVLLGTDCESVDRPCLAESDSSVPPPVPPVPDAQVGNPDDPSGPDPEVSPISDLEIENPEFERNGGADGDIVIARVATDIVGVILPAPPVTLPGWYACWPLSVSTNSKDVDGASVSMGAYLSLTPSAFNLSDFVAVRQQLKHPLRAGEEVHLQIQTIARNSNQTRMFLEVRGNTDQCGSASGTLLGRSGVIEDHADWRPICVNFTADRDFPVLMLKPAVEGTLPPLSQTQPTLLLDTIELVDDCP